MKTCTRCKLNQPLSNYHKQNSKLKSACKSCIKEEYLLNKQTRLSYQINRYREKSNQLKDYQRNWRKNNPHLLAAQNVKRRIRVLNATPTWLSDEHKLAMKTIYSEAQRLTKETGILHHVDHILPLISNVVCGLHVPWNLQILTAASNIKKSNRLITND